MGQRRRYGVIDPNECLPELGGAALEEFRANYDALIAARLAKDVMAREPLTPFEFAQKHSRY
jgi:hypothetical protein